MAKNTGKATRKTGSRKKTRVINAETGLYVKHAVFGGPAVSAKAGAVIGTVGTVVGAVTGAAVKGVTKDEIQKLAPVLKKLVEYDKKGK